MSFQQTPLAADLLDLRAHVDLGSTTETQTTEDGRKLEIVHGLIGAKYKIDGKHAYSTDAGTLLTGILVWGKDATGVYLPLGGRRRERMTIRAPRFLKKELASGEPVRVFFQRVGDLWAVERPGQSIVVRSSSGVVLEFCRITGSTLGGIEADRPWSSITEEQHVGRIALWAQVHAVLGGSTADCALAEDIRTAAFAATDAPNPTLARVLNHLSLRNRDLGAWSARFERRKARTRNLSFAA